MAKEYRLQIKGQEYFETETERFFSVYFSVPDTGIDENTGLCLLVAGFGGNAEANVYKKMRNQFADDYNMVLIQCDYFGCEFMDSKLSDMLFENWQEWFSTEEYDYYKENSFETPVIKKEVFELNETRENFCEMGVFQALDNLRAVKAVQDWIIAEGYTYDHETIIGYGHSQGAYLLYLCNALFPGLFSVIIDNSAWDFPFWLMAKRPFERVWKENIILRAEVNYQGLQYIDDRVIYLLETAYSQMKNTCKIYSYHGEKDALISLDEKKKFVSKIENCMLHPVGEAQVDGEIFKNTAHGLGADFLKMFDMVYKQYQLNHVKNGGNWNTSTIVTAMYKYETDLENGFPSIRRKRL